MKKMDGKSLDLTEQNIEKLKAIFPQVVTENRIDFEKLRLILGDEVDTGVEKYQFTWPGKADAIRLAQSPSTKTLRPAIEESKDWDTTKNLYIEGDNLEVLKQLQKTYHGKIGMIYLDPPYNTGKDYIYKNNFASSEVLDDEVYELNPESNSRFHSNWLDLMYPRLMLAKNLLKQEGFILASIDHYELFNLGKIMDEVFGRSNRLAVIAVVHKPEGRNQAKFIGPSHEYLLVYAKNIKKAEMNNAVLDEKIFEEFDFEDDLGPFKLQNFIRLADGKYSTKKMKPSFWYPIYVNKNNMEVSTNKLSEDDIACYPITVTGVERTWKTTKETAQKRIDEGVIVAKETHKGLSIYEKMRPSEVIRTHWIKKEYHGYHYGTKVLDDILGVKTFDFPKSLYLMKDILKLFSSKQGIVLDLFSGSATTAHATLQLNSEDGGNRQFIMIQLPEETDEKSEAYKEGYKNICEIGKERIRRAGVQIKKDLSEKKSKGEDVRDPESLDVGFKVFKLDETNIVPWDGGKVKDTHQIDLLDMLEDVFKEDRSSLDIAYEIMLKYGVFDHQLEKIIINDKEMFDVGEGYMLICLSENINMDDIQEIGKKGYMHVIFNDRSFKDDNVKLNAEHSLKNMGVEEVVSI